jgi:hypothetical protein
MGSAAEALAKTGYLAGITIGCPFSETRKSIAIAQNSFRRRTLDWIKVKNPASPAAKRNALEQARHS